MNLALVTLVLTGAYLAALIHAVEIEKLRRLMVDSRFVGLVSPCNTGGSTRNTAAEWLRTAFHDAASHDHAAGTGGIDGSIQFEMNYSENGGPAFPTTINQFKSLQQEGVSIADMIVLGAITAVASCGGPRIPFYAGRLDAVSPVAEGSVPLPEQGVETHKQMFARMGFSPTEMISLIACGHTIGGVHRTVNPRITAANVAPFDDTRTAFDNHVAVDYVRDLRTNPLAQVHDPAFPERSTDARTFASDGNVTMNRYAANQADFMSDCATVFAKMFNQAIPGGQTLVGPLDAFSVSTTFRTSLRNEIFHLQIGSSRVYNMVGQWRTFDVAYTNRDGSIGTDTNLLFVRPVRTLTAGEPIQIRDFSTRSPGIAAATGIRSVFVTLTLNDGSVYRSLEGEEQAFIDDTILIDVGQAYTCTYSGAANNNAAGINITMAVLGPFSGSDVVEVIYRKSDGGSGSIRADYRRPRDAFYNYYSTFIPNTAAIGLNSFGARVTKASGISQDDRNGIYYTTDVLGTCLDVDIPPSGPRPSSNPVRRDDRGMRQRHKAAPRTPITPSALAGICREGFDFCGGTCVDTQRELEHCGGCADRDMLGRIRGVDCTTLTDADVSCVRGRCVVAQERELW